MYKIGVFGSAEGDLNNLQEKVDELGEALGEYRVTVITGASTGLPYLIALKAKEHGVAIWGYSAGVDRKTQDMLTPDCNNAIYTKLFYIPNSFPFRNHPQVCRKYRNVTSTANCDAGIIISGRWGTLNEFTNLYDMGKIIGVLTKTGGIADELPRLCKKISKKSKAKIFFNSSPKKLVASIIEELKLRNQEKSP